MITWRGWGILVLPIGLVPFLFTVPFAMDLAQSKSMTGYFVWPLLISAGLTCGLDRLLRRYSHKRHDFMDITVGKWAVIYVVIAIVIAGIWLAEKLGWIP